MAGFTLAQLPFGLPATVGAVDGAVVLGAEPVLQVMPTAPGCGGRNGHDDHQHDDDGDDDPDPRVHEGSSVGVSLPALGDTRSPWRDNPRGVRTPPGEPD